MPKFQSCCYEDLDPTEANPKTTQDDIFGNVAIGAQDIKVIWTSKSA